MWATAGTAIARITPSGVITQFPLPDGYSGGSITAGSDGNLWFTEDSAIGRITPSGTITEFPYPRTGTNVSCVPSYDIWPFEDIAGAPSQDVWFIDRASVSAEGWRIGRITPSGEFSWYPGGCIQAIAAGPDGSIWYSGLVRIDPATGQTTTFPAPAVAITAGPDGNVWFTEGGANKIGRITPAGTITEFPLPAPFSDPITITTGPDGNLWFTEGSSTPLLGRITTDGQLAGTGGPNSWVIAAGPDGNLWLTGSGGIVVLPLTLTPVNVSSPSVSGTLTEGEVLHATTGTWINSPSTFSYQWVRCSRDWQCSPVPGATSESYVLSAADVDSRLQVGVSAATSDGAVSYAPGYSDYTRLVQARQPPTSLSAPTLVGAPTEGQTLTEAHGTWTSNPTAFTYQWQRCVRGTALCTDIRGATAQTYTLSAADVGSAIRVQEWASNAAGTGGPASSAQTTAVTPVPPVALTSPQMRAAPLISGTATVGLTLTASAGTWIGSAPLSFAYQWQHCNPGCANISGATGTAYKIIDQDMGAMVRVVVSASNAAGGALAASAQIGPVSPGVTAVKAQLGRVLPATGNAARIGALLRTGGYRTAFRAISGGRLTIDWYYLPTGARLNLPNRKPRPILIATGTVRFSRAGPVTLTIKLTTVGRGKLRTAKTLKLTAKGTYIPTGGQATDAARKIILHR